MIKQNKMLFDSMESISHWILEAKLLIFDEINLTRDRNTAWSFLFPRQEVLELKSWKLETRLFQTQGVELKRKMFAFFKITD